MIPNTVGRSSALKYIGSINNTNPLTNYVYEILVYILRHIISKTRTGLQHSITSKNVNNLQVLHGFEWQIIISSDDAVQLIRNGDSVTVGGFAAQKSAEEILDDLGRRYRENEEPYYLTFVFGGCPGDWQDKDMLKKEW